MKVQAQICMVINLDKCIGCHTCSVTCKNVWTSRKGMEYAWFNNVETKPGIGYPKKLEDQEKWQGGWEVKDGKAVLRHGSRPTILGKLFSSPRQPEVKDYYEPFTFDFDTLKQSLRRKTAPTARPYSIATGKRMDKVEDGPNWEDNLAGPFEGHGHRGLRRVRSLLHVLSAASLRALPASVLRGVLPERRDL